jgi:HSP20 family protein
MQLIPWRRDPIGANLARIRDEMDRTFGRLFNEPLFEFPELPRLREGWVPPLDVSETDNEVTIRAEVPGIDPKDLEITVTGRTLCIAGHKEEQQERRGENFYQTERRFGSFRRLVDLPESADPDKVTAETENGVVTIHVAKRPGAKPRQIQIRPAAAAIGAGSSASPDGAQQQQQQQQPQAAGKRNG